MKYPVIMFNCIWCGSSVEITIAKGLCQECYYLYGTDLEECDKAKIREKWLKYKVNDIRVIQKRRLVLKKILGEKGIPHDIFANVLCYVGFEGYIGDADEFVDEVVSKKIE